MKKLLILLVVLIFVGIVTIPLWTGKMADKAFENLNDPKAPLAVKEALKMKMRIDDYAGARKIAEKGYIYFSDNQENMPFYIYNAAVCGNKQNKPEIAIFWYERFIAEYPGHMWEAQAKADMQKIKELNGIK
jgi:hypothetical protein